jgi:hypothetical protein
MCRWAARFGRSSCCRSSSWNLIISNVRLPLMSFEAQVRPLIKKKIRLTRAAGIPMRVARAKNQRTSPRPHRVHPRRPAAVGDDAGGADAAGCGGMGLAEDQGLRFGRVEDRMSSEWLLTASPPPFPVAARRVSSSPIAAFSPKAKLRPNDGHRGHIEAGKLPETTSIIRHGPPMVHAGSHSGYLQLTKKERRQW